MKLSFIGKGNSSFLNVPINDETESLLNLTELCRILGCPRSSFQEKVKAVGYDQAIMFYLSHKKAK